MSEQKPNRSPFYYQERRFEKKHGRKRKNVKRICAEPGCGTILNLYNYNMCCSLHNFGYVIKHKIKVEIGNKNQ